MATRPPIPLDSGSRSATWPGMGEVSIADVIRACRRFFSRGSPANSWCTVSSVGTALGAPSSAVRRACREHQPALKDAGFRYLETGHVRREPGADGAPTVRDHSAWLEQLEQWCANGTMKVLEDLCRRKAPVTIRRSSGDLDVATADGLGFGGRAVAVSFIDGDRTMAKVIPTEDIIALNLDLFPAERELLEGRSRP